MAWESVYWENVGEGDELAAQTREMTRTTIVATAIASRDFQPVHTTTRRPRKKAPTIFS